MNPISRRIKQKFYLLNKFKGYSPHDSLIIFGDPRGGTTWAAELLKNIPNSVVAWEPLTIHPNSTFQKLNFNWRQFVPENEEWPEAKKLFVDVFKGVSRDCNFSRLNSIRDLVFSEKLIVKFCRANAMIPWLVKQFEFHFKPIYLVRHPFAVVSSQLRKGNWNYDYNGFEIPNCPYNEVFAEHRDFLSTLKTKEESLVAIWCITNLIPLRNPKNNIDWITVNYENLVLKPMNELSRIFGSWQLPFPPNIESMLHQPSSTTVGNSPLKGEDQITQWKRNLIESKLIKMKNILDYFECEFYSDDPFPLISFK